MTSDAGLLPYRELDDTPMVHLVDPLARQIGESGEATANRKAAPTIGISAAGGVSCGAAVVSDQPGGKLIKICAQVTSHGRYVTVGGKIRWAAIGKVRLGAREAARFSV